MSKEEKWREEVKEWAAARRRGNVRICVIFE